MFTGLIEEVGTIESGAGSLPRKNRRIARIRVSAPSLAGQLKTGNSVAVSGVCLTALDITSRTFTADLAAETVERTTLSRLRKGARVNLELPTRAGAPLGGHIVQGHVDGRGKVVSFARRANHSKDWLLRIAIPKAMEPLVVEKGSIAIEGISLTVAKIQKGVIEVAVIPHTAEVTNLKSLRPGDEVNLEADVMAKYAAASGPSNLSIERLMSEGF